MLEMSMAARASSLRHVRPVQPLRFPEQEPESERMGQGRRHLHLCQALYQMIRAVAAPDNTVGADQFVYFDAANPRRCLAPDVFVTLGVRDHDFDAYLVWEEGTPTLAFEVLSPSDSPERWTFSEKLRRYQALGVRELVVFFVDGKSGKRLRAWDRIDQDLVERVVTKETTPCLTLGLTLLIGPVEQYPIGLRVARDSAGKDLLFSDKENAAHERGRRQSAEARVAELERELATALSEGRPVKRGRRRKT